MEFDSWMELSICFQAFRPNIHMAVLKPFQRFQSATRIGMAWMAFCVAATGWTKPRLTKGEGQKKESPMPWRFPGYGMIFRRRVSPPGIIRLDPAPALRFHT